VSVDDDEVGSSQPSQFVQQVRTPQSLDDPHERCHPHAALTAFDSGNGARSESGETGDGTARQTSFASKITQSSGKIERPQVHPFFVLPITRVRAMY